VHCEGVAETRFRGHPAERSVLLEWAGGKRTTIRTFDGTLGSLVRCYQTDEASPYRELKWNTQRTYDQVLAVIEKAFAAAGAPVSEERFGNSIGERDGERGERLDQRQADNSMR
jgi:hypothetical protein